MIQCGLIANKLLHSSLLFSSQRNLMILARGGCDAVDELNSPPSGICRTPPLLQIERGRESARRHSPVGGGVRISAMLRAGSGLDPSVGSGQAWRFVSLFSFPCHCRLLLPLLPRPWRLGGSFLQAPSPKPLASKPLAITIWQLTTDDGRLKTDNYPSRTRRTTGPHIRHESFLDISHTEGKDGPVGDIG